MAVVSMRWKRAACAATLGLAVWGALAQTPVYKCAGPGTVTYRQVPCPGGTKVGAAAPHVTDKWKAPPQDRATLARRAVLSDEERQECTVLDARRTEQESFLKTRGEAATLQDELPLVETKKRARELKC